MSSGNFTDIFGGNNIAPAGPTYLALDISADVTLEWPIEQAMSDLVVANIIDVIASVAGLNINLPDATQASEGFVALINNVGAQTVSVRDATGGTIVSLVSGTVWQIYLSDNSTAAGVWRVFQFGASVSVAVAAALAGAGLKAIGTQLAERMVVVPQGANYVIVDSDRAKVEQWTSGVGQFTLPNPATVGSDWFVSVKNSGTGNLTVVPGAGTIDGGATAVYAPGASACIITDGNNFFTIFSGSATGGGSGFNLVTIDVSGSGNFPLAGAQLNQIGYKFIGTLTGNRHIIVPGTAQEYWVDNETTGAFTLDVGTAGQVTPVTILQGNRNILYCDGANVLPAETATVSFPIAVNQGGTGAITAAAARTNLGATTVGTAVFTAASAAAAQAALSVPPASRLVATSGLLAGGGDLSADRTLTFTPLLAYVYNSADQSASLVGTTQAWDSELSDQGGWHDPVTNNTRLTVPAGVAFVEISALITLKTGNGAATGWTGFVTIIRNGSGTGPQAALYFTNNSGGVKESSCYCTTGPIPAAPGDFFEVVVVGSNDAGTLGMQAAGGGGGILSRFMAKAIG